MAIGRAASVLALSLAVSLGASACSSRVIVGTGAQTVPVRIHGTPADAVVTIDDQRVGSLTLVAARGIRVLPGRHRITVEAPGYLPYDVAIEAKDAVVPVEVKLVPVPD